MNMPGPTGGPCAETSGFLFSHRCENAAVSQCARCNKAVCKKHTVEIDPGDGTPVQHMCTACGKKVHKHLGRRRDSEDAHGTYYRDRYYDDPYLYSSFYYTHYGYYGHGSWGHDYYDSGYDANSFSEADGASLFDDGNEFEHDMGAS
ncbi:hypothetical protein [Haliangium sp.]|uniref:hypothetical protein n=1 Tax=Haliangium sp. TaxID=2663208 RepID=UPI003D133459